MGKQELNGATGLANDPVEQEFHRLASLWKESQGVSSSLTDLFAHPAYQGIIRLGWPAVPYLLAELQHEPDWWFAALKTITGADPVPPSGRGKLDAMTKAWLEWGRTQGVRS